MGLIKQLRESEPFNLLPDSVFDEIRAAAVQHKYPTGSYIFQQNAAPTGYLYVIKDGLVEITVLSPGGVDMVVDYRKEGDFFGGTPIFTGEPYAGGARTVRDTECYLVPQEILKRAEQSCPQLGEYFTRIVYSRMRRLYTEIVAGQSLAPGLQLEAYPFKKRVSEVMSPAAAVAPTTPGPAVAARLQEGAEVLAVCDAQRGLLGLVTARGLLAAWRAGGELANLTAADLMQPAPRALAPDQYMFEALAALLGRDSGPLPVVDGRELLGLVTLRDLLRSRGQQALLLLGSTREAADFAQLATIRAELVPLARVLLAETRSTPEVMEVLSHIHQGIIRRAFELCLQQLLAEGQRQPEVRFCLLIMGSGGRREMLLGPDQDSGLIYEDVPDARLAEVEAFFGPLAERLSAALEEIGYPLCHGQVMASNPLWRGRLQDWRARIQDWVNEPEPQKVRYSSIFFDFAPLAGDPALALALRDLVNREVREFQGFLFHMMTLDLSYKVPLGLLGRFLVEKSGPQRGMLSLKQGGIVYLVDCIRMFALERGLPAVSTLERLQGLVEQNVFAAETAEHVRAAFEALTFLRLRHELAQIEAGLPPDHFLAPGNLSKNEQDLLREALSAVSKLQDATKRHFARTPF